MARLTTPGFILMLLSACFVFPARGSAGMIRYDFSGPDIAGSFITGEMAPQQPADAGYFLLESFTLTHLELGGGATYDGSLTTMTFENEASFNPTTSAFRNHDAGGTNDDSGNIDFGTIIGSDGHHYTGYVTMFANSAVIIREDRDAGNRGFIVADYSITGRTELPAVPEPATLSLALSGLVGLVGIGIRRRRKRQPLDGLA